MKHAWRWSFIILSGLACAGQRANYFNDPFLQVTSGIANCPDPEGPMIDEAQMKAEAHSRTERVTSCFLSGRCRLPNSYLYHHEIIPRVKKAILADGRFSDTSVGAEGQRRWVWLKGCVHRKDQAEAVNWYAVNTEAAQPAASAIGNTTGFIAAPPGRIHG